MDEMLKKLAEAPLANALAINLPQGRKPAKRSGGEKPPLRDGDLTSAQVRERRAKAQEKAIGELLDYYAGTEVPAERIARHLNFYRSQQTGTDDKGKPIFQRVLDTERVEAELAWRRKAK